MADLNKGSNSHITPGDQSVARKSDPNKMLKTKQSLTTEKKDDAKVLPVFYDYITKHYPNYVTELQGHTYIFRTTEQLGRRFNDPEKWILTDPEYEKEGIMKGTKIGLHYAAEKNSELMDLWDHIQKTGGNERTRNQFLHDYVQALVDADTDKTNLKVVKTDEGYSIGEIMSPTQQFLQDVTQGKIVDGNLNSKLSRNQVLGLPPDAGWKNKMDLQMLGGEKKYQSFKYNAKKGLYVGLMVSIDDIDESLKRFYKARMVVTDIIDDYHYRVKAPEPYVGDFIIRDTDIRSIIGDMKNNLTPLSDYEYTKEIVPQIKNVMENVS